MDYPYNRRTGTPLPVRLHRIGCASRPNIRGIQGPRDNPLEPRPVGSTAAHTEVALQRPRSGVFVTAEAAQWRGLLRGVRIESEKRGAPSVIGLAPLCRWHRPHSAQARTGRPKRPGRRAFSGTTRNLADNDPDRLGSMFVVMERLPGRGFLRGVRPDQFVPDFPKLCLRWPKVLLEVAARLHQVDPAPVLAAAARGGVQATQLTVRRHIDFVTANLEASGGHRTKDALAWLSGNEPIPVDVPSIIHGDLWPANVLMQGGHLTGLVDWTMAGVGDPALDLGYACAGLAMMPAPLPPPPPIRQGIHAAGKNLARRIKEQYCERTQTAAERIEFYEALRCLVELSAVLPYRYRSKGTSAAAQRPPWDKGVKALVRHFEKMSGVPISIV